MFDEVEFRTLDGRTLDARLRLPDEVKGVVVFWPCAFGSAHAKFYQIPDEALLGAGYGVFRYNPRSHGASQGTFTAESAGDDLLACLTGQFPRGTGETRLIGVAHSMGSAALLQAAARCSRFDRLFLAAPVLSSRESLLYMYGIGSVGQFLDLFRTGGPNDGAILGELATPEWTDRAVWDARGLRERLDVPIHNDRGIRLDAFATFLDSFFVRGLSAYNELHQLASRCRFFLPTEDEWFPVQKSASTAAQLSIPCQQYRDKTGHMLRESWHGIWDEVVRSLASPPLPSDA